MFQITEVSFSDNSMKCLSVNIEKTFENCTNVNWDKKLKDIKISFSKCN